MQNNNYSIDLSAKSWQDIEKLIAVQRKSRWDLKKIFEGILYLTKNGCVWRDLPKSYPPWQTVYWYFDKWVKTGVLQSISACLTIDYRNSMGKNAQSSVAIFDSQSVKNSSTCTQTVGIDGGKLIKGRKRFIIVDTLGNLLDSFVVAANGYDGTTALVAWSELVRNNPLLDNVKKIFADGTFGGQFSEQMKEKYAIEVEIPKIPIAQKGNVSIHAKRWIVERTIAWIINNRRCARDYERKPENANAFIKLMNIRRLINKIGSISY